MWKSCDWNAVHKALMEASLILIIFYLLRQRYHQSNLKWTKKNSWKEESCKRTKTEYWYGIIATLELKDLIATSEDTSLMTLLNNSNILQILQISVSNELEEFYWKLNSCYRLLILLSMRVMDPIIYNSSFGFSLQGQW